MPKEVTTSFALEEKSKLVKSLRRLDMVGFTLCAFVGLDTLGSVAANGPQGFFWLAALAVLFVYPYMLVMAELGSTFTQEGGPYEWTKLAWGRFAGGVGAILYWATNPIWVGGSLAFIATDAWSGQVFKIGEGTVGDYVFKLIFVWFSIMVAIMSLSKGKWIPNIGAILRVFVLGFFTIAVIVYGIRHGVHGFSASDLSPSRAVLLSLVPVILFNYVGFELQSGAAEEMDDPQKDVPISILRSGILGVVLYCVPVFGIILVLPTTAITGLGGFLDAVNATYHGAFGGAAHPLLVASTIGFVGSLITSGSVWMIGADRTQAVAAYDGSFFSYFGVFNKKLGTPVRVNVLSGVVATVFMVSAIEFFHSGADATFQVVLDIAVSTTLLSYILIFPSVVILRRKYPEVHRPFRVPFGNIGLYISTGLIMFWVLLGSWVGVFPGTLDRLLGLSYNFQDNWGVSRAKFETYTLGTLGIIFLVGVLGYLASGGVRSQAATISIEDPDEGLPEPPPSY